MKTLLKSLVVAGLGLFGTAGIVEAATRRDVERRAGSDAQENEDAEHDENRSQRARAFGPRPSSFRLRPSCGFLALYFEKLLSAQLHDVVGKRIIEPAIRTVAMEHMEIRRRLER